MAPPPNALPNPDVDFSAEELEIEDGGVELAGLAEAKDPNPESGAFAPEPKTLGVDAPIVPNGEVLADAKAPNPELANLSPDVLPNVDLIGFSVDDVDVSVVFDASFWLLS